MKRKAKPGSIRDNPKEEIIVRAQKGAFDSNPLIATSHYVKCKDCGFEEKITYLHYLKTGRFKLGESQMIEVPYAAPNALGLSFTAEKMTPIKITTRCSKCGNKISCTPVSVEYLLFAATKEHKMKNMYV